MKRRYRKSCMRCGALNDVKGKRFCRKCRAAEAKFFKDIGKVADKLKDVEEKNNFVLWWQKIKKCLQK